jgi:hypothetical protein
MEKFTSNDIYSSWTLIHKTINSSKTKDDIILPLIDLNFTKIYLSNNANNQKKIYIKLSKLINDRFSRPSIEGLKFDFVSNESIELNSQYLTISLSNTFILSEAFDGFSAALLMAINDCKLEADIPFTINDICSGFANFFSNKSDNKISDSIEVGLFGELVVLDELLTLFGDKAVSTWLGPEGNKHDFSLFSNVALEVKTSAANRKDFVKISNEFQLSNNNLKALYLRVIFLEKVNSGHNLNEFVGKIFQKIQDSQILNLFKSKLYQSKFDYLNDIRQRRFNIISDNIYLVDKSFPKLTFSNIPNEISDLSYKLSLKGIKPLENEAKQEIYVI